MGEVNYYLISDRLVGRERNGTCHLYDAEKKKWVYDRKHKIQDKLMGYDPSEPPGSPYSIGSMDVMATIESITEEEAMNLINDASS